MTYKTNLDFSWWASWSWWRCRATWRAWWRRPPPLGEDWWTAVRWPCRPPAKRHRDDALTTLRGMMLVPPRDTIIPCRCLSAYDTDAPSAEVAAVSILFHCEFDVSPRPHGFSASVHDLCSNLQWKCHLVTFIVIGDVTDEPAPVGAKFNAISMIKSSSHRDVTFDTSSDGRISLELLLRHSVGS